MIDLIPHRIADWLEQAWLERYLDRELDADETAWFETYLLDRPHLLEAVEADEDVRAAVLTAPNMFLAGDLMPGRETQKVPARPVPLWLAWAASLVVCVGATWFAVHGSSGSGTPVASAPSRIIYDTMRGTLTEPREEPGDPHSPIRLYEIPLPAGAELDTAFADIAGEKVSLPNPPVSADGYITFALPSSWRHNATLHLKLKASDPNRAELTLSL